MSVDAEYASAYHLLTTPLIAERSAPFIRPRDFDWLGLFQVSEPWSETERLLVQAAFDLWSGGRELDGRRNVSLTEPLWSLDDANLDRVIEALLIRRGRRTII